MKPSRCASVRRGQTILVVVLVVTAVLTVFVLAQSDFRRHAHRETVRVLAGQCALWSAKSSAQSAVADLMRAAGDPSARGYRELRRRILQNPAASADLTGLIEAAPRLPPPFRWAAPRRAEGPVGSLKLDRVSARLERIVGVPRPDGAPGEREDECVGLLVVEAGASATVGGVTVRRAVSECRELKVALAGPPRPFDAVGLYVGDLTRLTDPARANRARARVFAHMDWAVQRLSNLPSSLPERTRERLASVAAALPGASARDAGMPVLPERPAALVQVSDPHSRKVDLARLDLAAALEADVARIVEGRALIEQGLNAAGAARAGELTEQATTLARLFNQALMHGWFYQKQFRIVPRDEPAFTEGIAPYEERLAPAWYRRRTVHRLETSGPVFREWRSGARQLTGVFEVPGTARLELSGPACGRALLVTSASEVALRDITAGEPGEHLTLVSDAGRVTVAGNVHASLILGERASLVMESGSQLSGTLSWARPARRLALSGLIDNDGHASAGEWPQAALGAPGFSPYAIGLSPHPLWTEGGRE